MKLANMESLPVRVAIYVPSTVNVSEKINNSEYVKETACFLSDLFGGCTSISGNGYYISENKQLINESVEICYAFTTKKAFSENEEKILNYCEYLKTELTQECISLEYNNKLYFV